MPIEIPASSQLTDFWDTTAGRKEFRHPLPDHVIEAYFPPSGRILDVGCGYGRLAKQLSDSGFCVACTDSSSAMLAATKLAAPNCECRQCTTALPWESHTFDAAILVTLLTSVPRASDQQQLIGEVFRCLKPGGYVFVSDMPIQWSQRYTDRYENGWRRYGEYGVFDLQDGGTVRHHQCDYFLRLMSQFKTQILESHAVETMNGNRAEAFRYVGQR